MICLECCLNGSHVSAEHPCVSCSSVKASRPQPCHVSEYAPECLFRLRTAPTNVQEPSPASHSSAHPCSACHMLRRCHHHYCRITKSNNRHRKKYSIHRYSTISACQQVPASQDSVFLGATSITSNLAIWIQRVSEWQPQIPCHIIG